MAYPIAAGGTDYSSNGLVPTLYAKKLVVYFYIATCLTMVCNTDYEGQIKAYGDKVSIRQLPTITGFEYVKEAGIPNLKPVPNAAVELNIDKGYGWQIPVNTIDLKQIDIDWVNKWADHAIEGAKVYIDGKVLQNIYSSAHATNKGATAGKKSANINLGSSGSPLALTRNNVLRTITYARQCLEENDVPPQDTFMVIPAWCSRLLKDSDLKDCSMTGDNTSAVRNGRLGVIDGFTMIQSNNLYSAADGAVTATEILFGSKVATTFATQITEKEIIPNQNDFGKLLRGLQVYGYKVVQPLALGTIHAYEG